MFLVTRPIVVTGRKGLEEDLGAQGPFLCRVGLSHARGTQPPWGKRWGNRASAFAPAFEVLPSSR